MFVATFLGFLSLIPSGIPIFRTCIPNTQFQMNGHICYCDGLGQWSETNCEISRRKNCQPGQIIWEDCQQCICQEDGSLQCVSTTCSEDRSLPNVVKDLDVGNLWCLPFLSYYVNCSLCVCPATGKMSEARCAKDASCPYEDTTDFLEAVKRNVCIPKVMYLFPCLQCQCSDDGFFIINKCVENCRTPLIPDSTRKCMPNTFYRKDCNVCRCPDSGVADDDQCSKDKCNNHFQLYSLARLRNITIGCHRNTFTNPKCIFCECNQDAKVNENSCLESECISMPDVMFGFEKDTCSPGEMVPYCTECLCARNGMTDPKYCTDVCSHQRKLLMLEMAINESITSYKILDMKTIQKALSTESCEPNSIYFDAGKYCLCPDNGNTKFKLCTAINEKNVTNEEKVHKTRKGHKDLTAPCDPSTFIEFDCNTCYCQKNGKIDPKWCTYDDCKAKAIVQNRHKSPSTAEATENCVPGSILNEECNFCICPTNGLTKDKVCTTNNCSGLRYSTTDEKFSCEPLAYYNVDCNTCYCPSNGIKNVAKCTTNICEKSFLRSDVCVPGDLFSMECNVCVCPLNGDKTERVCTDHICSDADTPWKKIFKLSQSLMSNHVTEETTRSLELCFPGEEFTVGCKLCVCPDMGLRVYATCTHMLCGDERLKEIPSDSEATHAHPRIKRNMDNTSLSDIENQGCMTINMTRESDGYRECTPGSSYIFKCKKCICPYRGSIMKFCRPLPANVYCEQAFPGVNFVPMSARRIDDNNKISFILPDEDGLVKIPHNHTLHPCGHAGTVTDDCYICDCEDGSIVEEHCHKSDAELCKPLLVKSCKVGERVENGCNICICSKQLVYECTSITPCEITPNNSSSICPANSIFVSNETICICNRNGQWPHEQCNRIFQSFAIENSCTPGGYVNVDCNVCRCGLDGKIDKQHCTRNNCENLLISSNLRKKNLSVD